MRKVFILLIAMTFTRTIYSFDYSQHSEFEVGESISSSKFNIILSELKNALSSIEDLLGLVPVVLTASSTTGMNGSTTAGVFTDTNLSLTLSPGTWKIESNIPLYMSGATGSGSTGTFGVIRLENSSGIAQDVNGKNILGSGSFANGTTPATLTTVCISGIIEVLTEDVYKISFGTYINTGSPTISSLAIYASSAYGTAVFIATRID